MVLSTSLGHKIVVRFVRKPIWMPTAPSKLFRIAEHTFYSKEECQQIRKLQTEYAAKMNAIHKYMEKEFYLPATQAGGLPPEFIEKEREEERLRLEENDRINAEVAKKKQEYFGNLMQEMENKVLEEKMVREEALIQAAEKVDEFIQKEKLQSNNFVTPDNFDAMVEKILENPVSYEFFIDRRGKKQGLGTFNKEKVRVS